MSEPIERSLSLIYLVYNEEATLSEVLDEAVAFAAASLSDWEILVVDDGSRDNSANLVRERAARESRIRLFQHDRNRGMGAAMATGIRGAKKRNFVFLSADGQAPVQEISKLLEHADSTDIVVSTYEHGRNSWRREVLSAGLRLYMRVVAGIRFPLEGLYLFPTQVAQELAPAIEAETFFFSFELIDRALASGLRLAQTTMCYREREEGRSKVANWNRIRRILGEVRRYARLKQR